MKSLLAKGLELRPNDKDNIYYFRSSIPYDTPKEERASIIFQNIIFI